MQLHWRHTQHPPSLITILRLHGRDKKLLVTLFPLSPQPTNDTQDSCPAHLRLSSSLFLTNNEQRPIHPKQTKLRDAKIDHQQRNERTRKYKKTEFMWNFSTTEMTFVRCRLHYFFKSSCHAQFSPVCQEKYDIVPRTTYFCFLSCTPSSFSTFSSNSFASTPLPRPFPAQQFCPPPNTFILTHQLHEHDHVRKARIHNSVTRMSTLKMERSTIAKTPLSFAHGVPSIISLPKT